MQKCQKKKILSCVRITFATKYAKTQTFSEILENILPYYDATVASK